MPFVPHVPNLFPVRRRSPGDVPHGIPEELLHCHEETGEEEAAEGHPEAAERDPRHIL